MDEAPAVASPQAIGRLQWFAQRIPNRTHPMMPCDRMRTAASGDELAG
jgi:hypothetical protein